MRELRVGECATCRAIGRVFIDLVFAIGIATGCKFGLVRDLQLDEST